MKKWLKTNFNNVVSIITLVTIVIVLAIFFSSDFEYSGDRIVGLISVLTGVLSVSGIALAYMQFVEMKVQREQELEIVRKQKSLDLADRFKNILDDCSLVAVVFQSDPKFADLINTKNFSDFVIFRMTEFECNFPNEKDQELLTNLIGLINKNFTEVAYSYSSYSACTEELSDKIRKYARYDWNKTRLARDRFNLNSETEDNEYKQLIEQIDEKRDSMNTDNSSPNEFMVLVEKLERHNAYRNEVNDMAQCKSIIRRSIAAICHSLLNELEAWSMAFNIGLADSDSVYQSLHQAYIETVKLLYPLICKENNKSIANHYYSHIIKLYNNWVEVRTTSEKKEKALIDETSGNYSKL